MSVEIKLLSVKVGDTTIDLSIEDAKDLYNQLGSLFCQPIQYYPYWRPYENPWWVYCQTKVVTDSAGNEWHQTSEYNTYVQSPQPRLEVC